MSRYERFDGELVPVYDGDGEDTVDVITRLQARHDQSLAIVDNTTLFGRTYRIIMIRSDYKSGNNVGAARL